MNSIIFLGKIKCYNKEYFFVVCCVHFIYQNQLKLVSYFGLFSLNMINIGSHVNSHEIQLNKYTIGRIYFVFTFRTRKNTCVVNQFDFTLHIYITYIHTHTPESNNIQHLKNVYTHYISQTNSQEQGLYNFIHQ